MPPEYFPLRWESTGDQWWCASPIDFAAANGLYNIVRELLRLDTNLLIKLTSLRRIRRLETVWDDDEAQFDDVARCRAHVARQLLHESETEQFHNSIIRAGYGGWVMYAAASAGDVDFVKELLERDPLMVFGEGEYCVTDILYAASRSRNSKVFKLLLDVAFARRSCDVGSGFKWEMMNRAAHSAARGGNVEILRELLEGCCDVLVYRDLQGSTLLHTASGRGQLEVVKYLIESYNIIITARDNQGNTALHVAAYRGYLNAVKHLIHLCPSLASAVNDHGNTFFHFAVAGFRTPGFHRVDRQMELMKQLVSGKIMDLEKEDIINIRNKSGRTALHIAVSGNIQTNLVELLMSVPSIDLNISDGSGMTPLDLLKQRPKSASSEILIRDGLRSSPGSSFRISDAEILMYTDVGNPLSEVESNSSPLNHIQKRLKFLFGWPNRKEKKPAESEQWLVPLRQRYCSRFLSPSTSLRPSTRKKFSAELMHVVIQPKPQFSSAESCPSSGFGSRVSSPGRVEERKNQELSGSGPLSSKQLSCSDRTLRLSFHKGSMNRYFCLGAQHIIDMEEDSNASRENHRFGQAVMV